MRERISDWLLHLGWAFFGQECDCPDNPFNGLARWFGEGNWTDMCEPADLRTHIKYHVGCAIIFMSQRIRPEPPYDDEFCGPSK